MTSPYVIHLRRMIDPVIRRLDPRLRPSVHFVRFGVNGDKIISAQVGTEDAPFKSADFSNVPTRSNEIEKQYPRSQSIFCEDPIHGWTDAHEQLQAGKQKELRFRALSEATREAANAAAIQNGTILFCSFPIEIDAGLDIWMIEVQKCIHGIYHHLDRTTFTDAGRFDDFDREGSLINAVINECLRKIAVDAYAARQDKHIEDIDGDQVFLTAARKLMLTPARASARFEYGSNSLFDTCNILSSLTYEGEDGTGTLAFSSPEHPSVNRKFSFTASISLQNVGAVRKLLQVASGELSLLCDSNNAYAIGTVDADYDLGREDVFKVKFFKRSVWRLMHGDHTLMNVERSVPNIVSEFEDWRFREDLPRIYPSLSSQNLEYLSRLACSIAGQKHGCMLVISDTAAEEAKRLGNQCTKVTPFLLTENDIAFVTKIDGAVLVDLSGTCHAIGVILDGMASSKCSPDRGSRYNSAVRYVYGKDLKPKALAMVKSEDGMVNIIPRLMPRIHKSLIKNMLQQMRVLADDTEYGMGILWEVMSWFDSHEFYLTQDECDEIEKLRDEVTDKTMKDSLSMHRYRRRLRPTTEMDESYFLPE